MEPSLIDLTNVTICPKQVHQPHYSGTVIGNILGGDIHETCGTIRTPQLAVHRSTPRRAPHLLETICQSLLQL